MTKYPTCIKTEIVHLPNGQIRIDRVWRHANGKITFTKGKPL